MKKLIKQVGGGKTNLPLMPQKWLVCLLTLLVTFVGSSRMWADEYVFDQNVPVTFESQKSTFTFDTKNVLITNTGGKTQAVAKDVIQQGLKYSANVTYQIEVPSDEIIKSITFTGFSRDKDTPSYVDEVNDSKRDDNNNVPGSTQFPVKDLDPELGIDPIGTYMVNLNSPFKNTVSFKISGKETNLIITVVTEKADQKYTVNFSVPSVYGANVPDGTLRAQVKNGDEWVNIASGDQVNSGDIVKFTAWDFCGNEAQGAVGAGRLILDGWKVNGGNVIKDNIPLSGISWWHADISYELTVTSDIDFEAIYALDYFLHFKDNLGDTGNTYQYDGGTAYAYVDTEKLASNASGFRGNSTIIATATPADGWAFDHWEGLLKGAGSDPVWENTEWSKENPFTFTSSGSTFNYEWGYDIYIKPVFKNLGTVVGPNAMNKAWNSKEAVAYSSDVTLGAMQECTYEFDVRNGGKIEPWFSWIIAASENENVHDPEEAYFTLRPDNCVFYGWTPNDNQTLSLVGGALDWETFKRDIDGAHVTAKISFDGEKIFVYQVIENNGRTYTTYYPYTLSEEKEQVYLRLGVDQSQLTNYSAEVKRAFKVKTEARSDANVKDTSRGNIIMTNEQGNQVLEGSVVGMDTKIFVTAIPNDGYAFIGWNGENQANPRTFIAGYDKGVVANGESPSTVKDYTFYARFKALTNYVTTWNLGDVPSNNGRLQAKDGENFVDWTDTYNGSSKNGQHSPSGVEFSGIYKDNEELTASKGLLFNNHVAKMNSISDAIQLDANSGKLRIPVTEGEIVKVTWRTLSRTADLTFVNVSGELTNERTNNNPLTTTIIANGTGYIELQDNSTDFNIYIKEITKTAIRNFSFADGNSIPTQPGCDNYINKPVGTGIFESIVNNATFTWASSDPTKVQVDANTGRVTVNENFSGSVQITATMNAVLNGNTILLPPISKSYTLTTSTNKMYFLENGEPSPSEELDENGTVIYWRDVKWTDPANIPEGTIKYTILSSSTKKATLTEGDNDGDLQLTINGAGTTVIKATCGALSATYTLTTFGLVFPEAAVIYAFNGDYTQEVPNAGAGVAYAIDQKHGAIKDVSVTMDGATIKGLPAYGDNKGGAIVVSATDSEGKVAKYVLTIPYKKYTWDFYNEGQTTDVSVAQVLTEGESKHFKTGDLVNNTNPGAADEVPATADIPNNASGVFPGQYVIDGFTQGDAVKSMLTWQNAQDDAADNDPHKYWNYTFKTLTHKDKSSKKPIEYVNEPLFTYNGAINGNNVRVVNDTQGLVFNCAANAFGFNDNHNGTDQKGREQDRAILIYKGASFTIPFVQKDHYVKIHWYRHSTNAGDIFSVTNAKDLDGTMINPDHKLRFTGSHYESNSEYRGLTILQAASDGPITITNTAPSSWIELYTIEITDEYSTELKVEYAHVEAKDPNNAYTKYWGGDMASGYNNNWMFDMHENIVSVVRKVGDSANNKTYTAADLAFSDYASKADYDDRNNTKNPPQKVDNCAKIPTQRVGDNPIIYIGSFPGYTNGWNGWNLEVEAKPVPEDEGKLTIGLQKSLLAHVGNRTNYGVYALTNFEGTGTAHVIVRTKSGGVDGSPQYTLDQQEAYFPVGEYHPQSYPYTWDFTNYNMNNESVAEAERTYKLTHDSEKNSYGAWKSANGTRKMYTIANNEGSDAATKGVPASVPLSLNGGSNNRRYNKFLFADGSQFTYNKGNGAVEIRETDGLRMTIGADMSVYQDRAVTLHEDGSGINLGVEGGAITIPEVQKDMFVFVRSSKKPESVTGAVFMNDATVINSVVDNFNGGNTTVNMKNDQLLPNTYVYKVTGENVGQHAKYTLNQQWWGVKSPSNLTVVKEGSKTNDVLNEGYTKAIVEFDEGAPAGIQWCINVEGENDKNVPINEGEKIHTLNFANALNIDGIKNIKQFFIQNPSPETAPTFTINKFVLVDNNGVQTPVICNNTEEARHINLIWSDVVVNLAADTHVEAIGVTDEFKMMTNGDGWATDSRERRIDYSETATFTKSDFQPYIATASAYEAETDERELGGEGCPDNDHTANPTWHGEEEGWLHIIPVSVIEKKGKTSAKRGLILEDKSNTANKTIFNAERRLIPLFVPACNILDDNIAGNMITDHISEGGITGSNRNDLKYIFTNKYYKYDKNNPSADLGDATVVADYSYYILRQDGLLRANSSYLEVTYPSGIAEAAARQLYMYLGDRINDEETTGIAETDIMENADAQKSADIFTLSGVKLNGVPSKKGIYIMNGKKVFIK